MYLFCLCVASLLSGSLISAVAEASADNSSSSVKPLTLAERIADKKLWLGNKSSDSSAYLSISLHGAARRFVETGAYDVSVYSKGARLLVGFPECGSCHPTGFFSSLDLESYISTTPFWMGMRNLGGGFAYHRHRYYKNQIPQHEPTDVLQTETLRHVTAYKEQIAAIVLSPAFVVGATLGGPWGGWDVALGIEPSASAFNGGSIPTMHTKFFCETYGYSAPLRYKKLSGRLFAGGLCSVSTPGSNREWGIQLTPGVSVSGMTGIQAAWSFLRFGLAFGQHYRGAARTSVTYMNDYNRRVREYERDSRALANVQEGSGVKIEPLTIPLEIPAALLTSAITSYCAATWRKWTIGLSGQYEWNRSRHVSLSYVRVALGYAF